MPLQVSDPPAHLEGTTLAMALAAAAGDDERAVALCRLSVRRVGVGLAGEMLGVAARELAAIVGRLMDEPGAPGFDRAAFADSHRIAEDVARRASALRRTRA